MASPIGIVAPRYVVGELEIEVEKLSRKREILSEYNMPDIKEIWGWEFYRKTEKSLVDLAYESAARTLQDSGLAPTEIDALILCCCDGLNYHQQNQFEGQLSTRLGLGYAFVSWIGGAGCASLFSAMKVAMSLVAGQACKNVLIVSADKIDSDDARLQRFGVLSDGACSFIVVRSEKVEFSIKGVKVLSCPSALKNGGQDFQEKCQLIYSVFDKAGKEIGFDFSKTEAFFSSNIFIPIQEVELSVMPVNGLAGFQKNTAKFGHCYAADPIINLIDFYSDRDNHGIRMAAMASTAHGHFGLVLLERRDA
jgi:3-oxoacyl-[acyl-carrier-protein] synthase-3